MIGQLLVSGRSCGTCTTCCKVPSIDRPELHKTSGVLCVHCSEGGGCAIYATRPRVCRFYHCGWRMIDELDEDWRPDKSGILVELATGALPPGYDPPGFELMLVGPCESLLRPGFAEFVTGLVRQGIAVFLALPGPVGFHPARCLVNDRLAAVAAGDREAIREGLAQEFDALRSGPFEPVVLGGSG